MAVIMAGMEEGAVEGMREQQQMSSIQARRRFEPFMITDILSSVGNRIREEIKDEEEEKYKEDEDEEKKPRGHGLDMRLLFPVLGGHNGHNRVDAESGEEADEDDGEDGERGEFDRRLLLVRKPSKKCSRCGFYIGPTGAKRQNGKLTPKTSRSLKSEFPWLTP